MYKRQRKLQLVILYQRPDESQFLCNITDSGIKTAAVQVDWAVANTEQDAIAELIGIHGWDAQTLPPILV